MAKSIKKELKRPDEFVSFWTRFGSAAADVIDARKRAIAVGATALVTVILGLVIFSEVSERQAIRSTQGLERVSRIQTADLIPETGTPKDDGVPHFKTEKERAEASLKELDAFMAAEPRSPLRAEAALQRGGLLLTLGRTDEALAVYEPLAGSDSKLDPRLRFLAREGLGYAYERKGDLDKAAGAFNRMSEEPGTLYKDRSLYQKARIAQIRGNRDEAAKLYQEVLDKNPTTSLRDEITNRLAMLELK